MPHPDFLVLQPSSEGHVYMIGDVHGTDVALNEVIKTLNPKDTLIILGDLIDRYFDADLRQFRSAAVLDSLIARHNNPDGPRIYAIKGNHETDFLFAYDLLFKQTKETRNQAKNKRFLENFIRNGGGWIFKYRGDEDSTRNLHSWFRIVHELTIEQKRAYKDVFDTLIADLCSEDDVSPYVVDNIKIYQQYIAALPYIIKLEGESSSSWAVHAALFLSDDELNARITANQGLSYPEKYDITQARPEYYNSIPKRNRSSHRVFCGHNIVDTCLTMPPKRNSVYAVRHDSNHINLDLGACYTRGFLVVDVTENTAKGVGCETMRAEDRELFEQIASEVTEFLQAPPQLQVVSSVTTVGLFQNKPQQDNSHLAEERALTLS